MTDRNQMPDIANEKLVKSTTALSRVGMSGMEFPILLLNAQNEILRVPSRIDATVSLDNVAARGIHMSRLYLETQRNLTQDPLDFKVLSTTLDSFLKTHEGLSDSAEIRVSFEGMTLRNSLKSELQGWRSYPVILRGQKFRSGRSTWQIQVDVIYSSTCPASAALSRHLIQENFQSSFQAGPVNQEQVKQWLGSTQGIIATPHAQRSRARVIVAVELCPASGKDLSFVNLVDIVEEALGTPVQAAVKREDEQEFALRNGQNLMFCEDAARRLLVAMGQEPRILDFRAELRHFESLHPHDALSEIAGTGALNFL